MAERPGASGASGPTPLPHLACEIRFAYPGADFSLCHVDLTIPFGQSGAVVGRNGSGKRPLLTLLLRLWDPLGGRHHGRRPRPARRDAGVPHAQCGVVFQDTFLLNRSVRDNIALGRAAATDWEVEEVTRAAHIHDVIAALPDGYDMPLGERGAALSGGQRQRLALARAGARPCLADPRRGDLRVGPRSGSDLR